MSAPAGTWKEEYAGLRGLPARGPAHDLVRRARAAAKDDGLVKATRVAAEEAARKIYPQRGRESQEVACMARFLLAIDIDSQEDGGDRLQAFRELGVGNAPLAAAKEALRKPEMATPTPTLTVDVDWSGDTGSPRGARVAFVLGGTDRRVVVPLATLPVTAWEVVFGRLLLMACCRGRPSGVSPALVIPGKGVSWATVRAVLALAYEWAHAAAQREEVRS